MAHRAVLTFTCQTCDAVSDEGVDGLFPSGEAILHRLCQFLARHGAHVGNVLPHKFYGWSVSTEIHGRRFWLLLQYPATEEFVISIEQSGVFNFLRATRNCDFCLDELFKIVNDWVATDCRGAIIKRERERASLSF